MIRAALLAVFFLGFLASAAVAEEPRDIATDTKAVESYLNGLTTLRGRFIQTAHDGQQAAGTFLLKRPGRMRFEYDPPVTDFIVADGLFIHYYDGQLKQHSSVPTSKSLADFFLRENLALAGDLSVATRARQDGLLKLTLVQSGDPAAGALTLAFEESPLRLKGWRIVDAQGLTTDIELLDLKTGIDLKNSLFHYYDPEHKDPGYN